MVRIMKDDKKIEVSENKIESNIDSKPKQLKTDFMSLDSNLLDKKLITGCAVSAIVSVITVFVVMKIGLNYHEEKIQRISENYESINSKVKSIVESISDLNSSLDSLKSDLKNGKESSSYIYTSLSSLQNDISVIKDKLNIDTDEIEDSIKKLPSEKSSFIESFENLIKDGSPFDSFLESYADKIDMKKYQTAVSVVKLSQQNIKSLSDLKKDFVSVGFSAFQTKFSESFWEKQKRIIKEKISEAIKIRKTDDKAETINESLSDKSKFEKAGKLLSDGKLAESVKILESLKIENEDLGSLISDIRKRQNLENAFFEFKKEFIETENGDK